MPYRRTYKPRYGARRTTYRRKYGYSKRKRWNKKYGKATKTVTRSVTTFPDRQFLKMKWNYMLSAVPTVAAPQSRMIIRGNSVYDPDYSGVSGGQPFAYTEMSALYNQYRVYGSRYKVEIMPANINTGNYVKFSLYPQKDLTDISTDQAGEAPYSKSAFVGGSNATSRRFLKGFMTSKKIYGFTKISQDPNFAALVTANPFNEWYWILDYSTVDGSNLSSSTQAYLNITVTYYVEFFDRKNLAI